MNDTLYQMQTVITLAIASTIVTASTVAQSPALLPKAAEESSAIVNGTAYSFKMTLPKRSRSRFTKLSFSLMNLDRNSVVPLPLNLQNTIAQSGKSAIVLKGTFIDETGTLWVEFNSPLPENTPLTVIFKAREPLLAGRYSYSIAAYPEANSGSPQFVDDGTFTAK
ncbi:DUF2808 domain-containing protein [Leptolyngbya sp. AN03gr2]|uniref:DUF2808 domain-containing protein n=1 Tax=unclassified Leptolyngbya TaxID=2650499 RepID=UPI003D316C59